MAQKIGDAFVSIGAKTDKLDSAVKKSGRKIETGFSKATKGLNNQFSQLGKTFAAAFAVQKITQFTAEAVKLASVAEGVKKAFDRLNDPTLLNNLKEATRGTVSELDLMKQAVQAKNLGVPIKNLADLFAFATQRAADTGLEVDYLVESLVTGIGKKSTMVLDNLGISAVDLRKNLGGVSTELATVADFAEAVGKIGTASLEKIGKTALTSAQKIAQLESGFEDLKTKIGTALIPVFEKFLPILNDVALGMELTFASDPMLLMATRAVDLEKSLKGVKEALASEGGTLRASDIEAQIKGYEKLAKQQQKSRDEAKRSLEIFGRLSPQYKNAGEKLNEYTSKLAITKTRLDFLNNTLTSYNFEQSEAAKRTAATAEELRLLAAQAAKFKEAPVSSIAQKGIPQISGGGGSDSGSTDGLALSQTTALTEAMVDGAAQSQIWGNALGSAFSAIGSTAAAGFSQAGNAFGAFAAKMIGQTIQMIAQAQAVATANAIAGGTSAGAATGPAAVFTTPAFIGGMLAMVVGAFASIPKFEKGGQSRGGMALVGEAGPEMVNLPKGGFVSPNHQSGFASSGGGGNRMMNLSGSIKGRDIQLSNSRTNRFNTRTTGI